MGVMLVTWKDIKELVTTSDFYIRLRVQAAFNAPDIDEVIMTGASTISLTEEILFTINDGDCGVTVIGAPVRFRKIDLRKRCSYESKDYESLDENQDFWKWYISSPT